MGSLGPLSRYLLQSVSVQAESNLQKSRFLCRSSSGVYVVAEPCFCGNSGFYPASSFLLKEA
jgi:hypothetical protein